MKRLYVHDEVCDELVAFARKMKVGRGTDENVVIGSIQNRKQYNVVAGLVRSAKSKGRVLLGGKPTKIRRKTGGKGYFYPLTTVADLDNKDRLVDEE